MNTNLQTKWTTTLVDAGDGSGDAIISLPDELLELLGWVEGDELLLDVVGNSITFIRI